MKRLPTKPLENCLKIPAVEWVNRCSEIAHLAVNNCCVPGSAIYGGYYGPVSPECPIKEWYTRSQQGITIRHGWIRQKGGIIIDPTRWVFEAEEPYVALIMPGSYESQQYDPGNQRIRHVSPPPARDPNSPYLELKFSLALAQWAANVLDDEVGPPFTQHQVHWLANLPPKILGPVANELYSALKAAELQPLIPIDFWDLVFPNYCEEATNLDPEYKNLYTREFPQCAKCGATTEECFAEDCENEVCWACDTYLVCEGHLCHECEYPEMHKCLHCLTVYCAGCEEEECPKCGLPSSERSEI